MKESVFHNENEEPVPSEIREKLVALARAGRSVESLTRKYKPCAATIREWVRQAGADDVLKALYPLLLKHDSPEYVRSNNGPEFAAEAMQGWLRRVGIKPIRIYLGSPWENGYNERFNGTLRREVLSAEWFTTTEQAQIVINHWLRK